METSQKISNVIRTVIILVSFVAIVYFVMSGVKAQMAFNETHDANTSQRAALQATLDASSATERVDEESMALRFTNAGDAGRKVAELQNKYATTDAVADPDGFTAIADELDTYCAGNSKDARVPWGVTGTSFRWEFMSGYDYTESKIDVLWLGYDDANNIVEYVTGKYDSESGQFSSVMFGGTENKLPYIEDSVRAEAGAMDESNWK